MSLDKCSVCCQGHHRLIIFSMNNNWLGINHSHYRWTKITPALVCAIAIVNLYKNLPITWSSASPTNTIPMTNNWLGVNYRLMAGDPNSIIRSVIPFPFLICRRIIRVSPPIRSNHWPINFQYKINWSNSVATGRSWRMLHWLQRQNETMQLQ